MRPPSQRQGYPPERFAGRLHRLHRALERFEGRVRRLARLPTMAAHAAAPQLQQALYRLRLLRSVVAQLPQRLRGGAEGPVGSLLLADSRLPALLPTLTAAAAGLSANEELDLVRWSDRHRIHDTSPSPYRITANRGDQHPRALPCQLRRRR